MRNHTAVFNLTLSVLAFHAGLLALIFTGGCSFDNHNKSPKNNSSTITGSNSITETKEFKSPDFSEAKNLLLKYQASIKPYVFKDFPADSIYKGKPAALDVSSHIDAALYRKTFTRALQAGSNFAGHFTLVTIVCGTDCQDNYVIDTRTGIVYDKVKSIIGALYQINSKLLILNPPNPENISIYQKLPGCKPEIYLEMNNLLYKIKLVKK